MTEQRSQSHGAGDRTFTRDGIAFRARGLERRFGALAVLSELDLEVPEHAFFLLVGRNGAGKTTLLKLLLGLLGPSAGELALLGIDPGREGSRVRAAAGYVPEERAWPFSRMEVQDFLEYHAAYRPWWDPAYAGALVRVLEVPVGKRMDALSKGEFRRAELVAALAHRPPVLVMDEPSDGLDPVFRERLKELLAEHLASWPTTVILSTHVVGEVEGFADHLGVLRDGRVEPVLSRERLAREGRRMVVSAPRRWTPPDLPGRTLLRRSGDGGEELWITLGDEGEIRRRVEAAGGRVADARPLGVEEAAVALLGGSP